MGMKERKLNRRQEKKPNIEERKKEMKRKGEEKEIRME